MKEKILHKASDLFLNFGFKSVTMDDIASKMGISKKTIYSHFPTKLDLVRATAFYVFEKINTGICSICASNENPIQEIFSIKSLVMKQLKGEKASPQFQLEKYYPRIFKSLRDKQFGSIHDCISGNLQRGIDEGYYRPEIDKTVITMFYVNGLMSIQDGKNFKVDINDIPKLKEAFLEYHIRAIASEKGIKTLNNILEK